MEVKEEESKLTYGGITSFLTSLGLFSLPPSPPLQLPITLLLSPALTDTSSIIFCCMESSNIVCFSKHGDSFFFERIL